MTTLLDAGAGLPVGLLLLCALGLLGGLLLIRHYYRRLQIQQVSKISKEFRQQQALWEDQRKALEENAALLGADLKEAQGALDTLRREHSRQSGEWQENSAQLGQRIKSLYQLVKKHEQERADLDKKMALASADWRREKEQLQRAQLRLRGELDSRGGDSRQLAEYENVQRELREQLTAAQGEIFALQRQLADQGRWAEQVQQTLEDELNRVSQELTLLQQEKSDNVKTLIR